MASFGAGVAKATEHTGAHAVEVVPGASSSSSSLQQQQQPNLDGPERHGNVASRTWRKIMGSAPPVDQKPSSQDSPRGSLPSSSSQSSLDEKKEGFHSIQQVETAQTTFDAHATGMLFNEGQLVLIPAASEDPRDPMNLPLTRKLVGLGCLCIFGAFAASAELILGAMLPVFSLYYAGINPTFLLPLTTALGGLPAGSDPLKALESLPHAPPIWKVYLLASLPVLMMGVANLILIPSAIAVGRRPVILLCGLLAVLGAVWSAVSKSLDSHLIARCLQALGAGTVESLIPFIIQDMVYVHQRNTAISGVFAAQGVIIIGLGIASPYMIIYLTWRWCYWITAAAAGFFLIGVFLWLPETRWNRTRAMMQGEPPITTDAQRAAFQPRDFKYNIALTHGKLEWKKGWIALMDTFRTFFYPHIFFITMLNSAMIATAFAAGYTVSPVLLTQPYSWPFLHLGFCLFPILIAAIFVGVLTGKFADGVANWMAKKRGVRLPEYQILNLILPTICGIVGSVLFGLAGDNLDKYPWPVFLFALGLMAFGFLGANTVGAVYVLECYPNLAGPALVNIASFRCLIAFILSFRVSEWIVDMGYFDSMMIYTGIMAFFGSLLPIVYIWGPAWRKRWPGPVGSAI